MPEKKKTVFRDSESGEFITKKKAERNPRTTEKERVRIKAPRKGR